MTPERDAADMAHRLRRGWRKFSLTFGPLFIGLGIGSILTSTDIVVSATVWLVVGTLVLLCDLVTRAQTGSWR
jgi:hypothetical protein